MYCSSCGIAVAQGLSYCNHCGAKLNRGDSNSKSSEVRLDSLVFGMLATFVFGLIGITVLMGVMKAVLGLPVERVLAFSLLPFLMMLLMEGVFIRLMLRRNRGTEQIKEKVTSELEAAQARVLPEPMSSVTDHTTRAFDPIYTERTSKT